MHGRQPGLKTLLCVAGALCAALCVPAEGAHIVFEHKRRVVVGYEVKGNFLVPVFGTVGRRVELRVEEPAARSWVLERTGANVPEKLKPGSRAELDEFFSGQKDKAATEAPVSAAREAVVPERRSASNTRITTMVGRLRRAEGGSIVLVVNMLGGTKEYYVESDNPARALLDERGVEALRVVVIGLAGEGEDGAFIRVRTIRALEENEGTPKAGETGAADSAGEAEPGNANEAGSDKEGAQGALDL